jgi:hypothetical protein
MYKTGSMKEFMLKFKTFSEEAQTSFWQSVNKPGLTMEQLSASMDHCLDKFTIEQQVDSIAGQYQPLSWYAAQGYDVDLIKGKCTDIMKHEIFGDTYRVNIVGSDLQTINGNKRSDAMNTAGSSSNGGSSRQNAGTRQADSAANQKEAETQRQEQQKEMKAMQAQLKKRKEDAGKILAKLTPEQCMLGNLMKSKDMKTMPPLVIDKVKCTNTKMVAAIGECKDILNNRVQNDCSITVKDAEGLVKTSALQRDFVNNLVSQNMVKSMP